MMKRLIMMLLIASLAGCGGESSSDSKSGSSTKNKPAAGTDGKSTDTPGDGKTDQEKTDNKKTEDKKTEDKKTEDKKTEDKKTEDKKADSGGQAASRVRTDGIFTAAKHASDTNKLKILALALHNYHDVYRKFPMVVPGDGRVSKDLSWRVLVLPYMELMNEFDQFDTSQGWDSEKNKPLADSSAMNAFKMYNGNLICEITHKKQPKSFRDIVDGTSNTIVFMENPTADADKWTQPLGLSVDDAVKIIKSLKKGEFLLAAFYDGSVRKIYSTEGKNVTDQEIAQLFEYKDLKPIDMSKFDK